VSPGKKTLEKTMYESETLENSNTKNTIPAQKDARMSQWQIRKYRQEMGSITAKGGPEILRCKLLRTPVSFGSANFRATRLDLYLRNPRLHISFVLKVFRSPEL